MPKTKTTKKPRLAELLEFDSKYLDEDTLLIGVDEVGRGCLAGPVCTGAFAYDLSAYAELSLREDLADLDDSKKLNANKRAAISKSLLSLEQAYYSLDIAPVAKVDEQGIMACIWGSMKKNIQEILINLPAYRKLYGAKSCLGDSLSLSPYRRLVLLVDGPKTISILHEEEVCCFFDELDFQVEAIVRGDSKSAAIAAASNLAKNARDEHMYRLARIFPGYAFETNVGYGTKAHREAIAELGLSRAHRKSFCSNFV